MPHPEENTPWTEEVSSKYQSKQYSEYYDPCQEAAGRSIRCLHRNAGDRDMCQDYFQAYRDCKKAWIEARREEKRKQGFFGLSTSSNK